MIIPCATAVDAKTTKLHVENMQAQIKKKRYMCSSDLC